MAGTGTAPRRAQTADGRRRVAGVVPMVEQDGQRTGFPRWLTRTVLWLPLAGVPVLAAVYAARRPLFYTTLREDHVVEWLQFTALLVSAALALVAVRHAVRRRQVLLALALLGVGMAALFLSGEEISWGQRVFALTGGGDLTAVNSQGELNVHNIKSGIDLEDLFKVFSWLLGVVGVGLSLLVRGPRRWLHGRFWSLVAPPLCSVPGFLLMVLYRPLLLLPVHVRPLVRAQEWVELSLYLSLAATVCAVYLRLRSGPAGEPAAPGTDGGADPDAQGQWRVPVTVAVLAAAVTVVFAALTAYHGIVPVNG